ncbi:hypothetical protein [Roseobacter sinensis]|uniref:Uncharacterized protein n=1 Tax=Roseobacter sinensis TaxID=2931391 RepID=A0ABT3BKQ6_9RHOB|nr:hypothetical protein [Roseobacter sp. WL0113]MCV3274146.1 hypothetical protein [Roseobacter sp. WL0113]
MDHEMDQNVMQSNQPQTQAQGDQTRDLEQERQVYERMLERQSEASRQYTVGKFRSA